MSSMPLLLQIALACLLGGLMSVAAASLVMFGLPRRFLGLAVSFSIGLLLATAMLQPAARGAGKRHGAARSLSHPARRHPRLLRPGKICHLAPRPQRRRRHRRCTRATAACEDHTHSHHHLTDADGSQGEHLAILVGDGFHNFTDGLLIAAAFLADPALGWATTFAIIAHEVPQEAGDFAILLAAGWKRGRALFWNGVSSLAAGRRRHRLLRAGTRPGLGSDHPHHRRRELRLHRHFRPDAAPQARAVGIGWHGLLLAAGIAVVMFGGTHVH
jgi:zinc and cadmium transporter